VVSPLAAAIACPAHWADIPAVHVPSTFLCDIFPSFATLSDLDILSFLMHSLRVSLTSHPTLEHLKFKIAFKSHAYPFDNYGFYEELRDADVWDHLDSIITGPVGSRLQRVDINILYAIRYGNDIEPHGETADIILGRAIVAGLPLLAKKGILFVEVTLLE